MRYLIVLDGIAPGVGYDVTVSDLPGCTSAGDTLGEAINAAAEAIRGHVQTLVEVGQPVGLPSTGAPVDVPAGHLVGVVDVDLEKSDAPPLRAARLNVSIPATALGVIDAAAKVTGTTRSAFLTRAARSSSFERERGLHRRRSARIRIWPAASHLVTAVSPDAGACPTSPGGLAGLDANSGRGPTVGEV